MKKLISYFFTALLAIAALSSCSSTPALEEVAKQADKKCPVTMPGVGRMESVTFENGTLTYKCLVLNRSFNLKAMEGNEAMMKEAMRPMLSGILLKDKRMGELLVDEKASLAVNYYTKGPKAADITIVFSPDEIKAVMDGKVADDTMTKLKGQIAITSAQCPIRVDSDTKITSLSVENGYVVYTYSMNESSDPEIISDFNENKEAVAASILETMRHGGKDIKAIINLAKDADCGFMYRYIGDKSGDVCEIKIEKGQF